MPMNPRWPDFQLASKLRQLMGSQPNVPEGTSAEKSSSLLGKDLEREQDYIEDSQDPGFNKHIATMSDMEDQHVGAAEDLDHLSHDEAGVDDADFGDLEMFDSNTSPAIYSQVSQLVRSDDPSIPEARSASKRDKKKKKKKEVAVVNAAEQAELEASTKKRKQSKKSSLRETEAGDGLLADEEELMSSSIQPSEHLAGIEGAVSDMHVHELSTQKTKKRKLLDSVEDKRKKRKPRDQVPEDIIEATQEEDHNMSPGSREGHAAFLRTGTDNVVDSLNVADDDEEQNSDSQLSPSVARARRRSNSAGPQSAENGVSFKAAVAPMAAMTDVEDANISVSLQTKADTDVEDLAREAWREHMSTQNEIGEDLASHDEADGHAISVKPTHEEEPDKNPRNRRTTRAKQSRPIHDAPDEATAGFDIDASEETPRRKSRGKVAVKKSQGRPPPKERVSSAAKPTTPKFELKIGNDEEDVETPLQNKANGYIQGRFSDDELSRLHRAVERFREKYDLTQIEMNEMIHAPGGTSAGSTHAELWLRLTDACPNRRRQKVINVARKNFHNFVARGTWTLEQDAELTALINMNGTAWSKIAAIINRHPEDVRDRYRNYIVCGAAQKKDVWDVEEEARLIKHVQDAIVGIDEIRANKDDPDLKTKSYEELIDWQYISEMMDRTRSRLQCITKWKLINKRLENPPDDGNENPTEKRKKNPKKRQEANAEFAKLEAARRKLTALGDAEQYRLVLAIDQATTYAARKVAWSKVTERGLINQWTRASQLLFWHRLQQIVPESQTKSVKEITQYIINLYNQAGSMPDLQQVQNDEEEAKALKLVRGSIGPISQPKSKPKSAEIVEDSSVEDEAPSIFPGGEMDDLQMNIDPALSQASQPVQNSASSKKRTPGRQRSKKLLILAQDPIEDVTEQNNDVGEESMMEAAERKKRRNKKTPSKPKSMDRVVKDSENLAPLRMSSDSEMDDMEDLPARIPISAVKAH